MILLLISSFLSILNIFISKYLFEINRCVMNRGIAFGIQIELTVFISIILLLILVTLGCLNKGIIKYLLFSIFLFGLSNLTFRLLLGGICDYIAIPLLSINIADLGIVILSIYTGIQVMGIKRGKNK